MDIIIDSNVLVSGRFTIDFHVKVIKGRSEEREDIETPVDLTSVNFCLMVIKSQIAVMSLSSMLGGMVMDEELASTSMVNFIP